MTKRKPKKSNAKKIAQNVPVLKTANVQPASKNCIGGGIQVTS